MKKYGLLFVLLVFLSTACQENTMRLEEAIVETSSEYSVSQDMAEKVAVNFFNRNKTVLTKSDYSAVDKEIEESYPLKDEKSKAYLYVVNYEDGGFALVSSDNRMDPVLAYSDDGYFDENVAAEQGGLMFWLSCVKEYTQELRESDEVADEATSAEWNKYAQPLTKAITPPTDPCANLLNVTVGPLLTTQWHQRDAFNGLLPVLACGPNGRIRAGCTVIAIAQTLKYYQYPSSYQWSQMPATSANTQTQSLILNIYNYIKGVGKISSADCNGTSVPSSYDLGSVFKNAFGYKSGTQATYNYSTVKSELSYSHPVILRGGYLQNGDYTGGHDWVCDGYHAWEACAGTSVAGYLTFHFNWGAVDGINNGWYNFGNFLVGGNLYNQQLKMVYNIRK